MTRNSTRQNAGPKLKADRETGLPPIEEAPKQSKMSIFLEDDEDTNGSNDITKSESYNHPSGFL
jgi:hypothetical protein